VPNVIGLDVDQARRVMEDLGFLVTIVGNGNDDALVVAQEPAAAAVTAVGAEIRLHVG
jgi:beta-lactam-binding protein with PASTA domain